MMLRSRVLFGAVAAAVILIAGSVGFAGGRFLYTSHGVVRACVRDTFPHTLRVVRPGYSCLKGESLLTWNVQGPPGPQGPVGSAGPAGPTGRAGSTWLTGAADPNTSMPSGAAIGDDYLDTVTGEYYQLQPNGTWAVLGNLTGPSGSSGPRGATWFNGSQPPSATSSGITPNGAMTGDYYLDTATGEYYELQGSGSSASWAALGNLTGPQAANFWVEVGSTGAVVTSSASASGITVDHPGTGDYNLFLPSSANPFACAYEVTLTDLNGTAPGSAISGPYSNTTVLVQTFDPSGNLADRSFDLAAFC